MACGTCPDHKADSCFAQGHLQPHRYDPINGLHAVRHSPSNIAIGASVSIGSSCVCGFLLISATAIGISRH
jgi:hypothetical protein